MSTSALCWKLTKNGSFCKNYKSACKYHNKSNILPLVFMFFLSFATFYMYSNYSLIFNENVLLLVDQETVIFNSSTFLIYTLNLFNGFYKVINFTMMINYMKLYTKLSLNTLMNYIKLSLNTLMNCTKTVMNYTKLYTKLSLNTLMNCTKTVMNYTKLYTKLSLSTLMNCTKTVMNYIQILLNYIINTIKYTIKYNINTLEFTYLYLRKNALKYFSK
jgi:hypothetical protein